jgi:hypothetical protein
MPIDREQLTRRTLELAHSDGLPHFNPGVLGEILLFELEENWDRIPDITKGILLGVAASLIKQYADESH